MKLVFLSAQKVKDKDLLSVEAQYLKRLKSFASIELRELEARSKPPSDSSKLAEFYDQKLIDSLSDRDYLVLLDERGELLSSSEAFSEFIRERQMGGHTALVFAVGSAFGWGERAKARADSVISLSPLTLQYGLCRTVLVEQVYRSYTLLNGIPYHK